MSSECPEIMPNSLLYASPPYAYTHICHIIIIVSSFSFSFTLDTHQLPPDTKSQLVVCLLANLIDPSLFDSDSLLRFALTVSKNYRPFPYHNWDHAFYVAHCGYTIMMGSPQNFTTLEASTK